jgi:hypothetical protein
MLELQNVYKNLHSIQSMFNFGCFIDFINIFVSMKIKLLRLNETLKVAQLSSFIFLKFRIIVLKKMHSNFRMYCVLRKCTEFYFAFEPAFYDLFKLLVVQIQQT